MMQAVHERSSPTDSLDITRIAREHYDSVFRFCARRVGLDAAADVTQETFVTAQRAIRRFRSGSSLKTWLLGIAHNECRRHARGWRRSPQALELIEAAGESPEGTWINTQALRAALQKLTPEQKEAVVLIELDGLSYDEAAKVAGVPAGTVKSRLHYAFQSLRKSFDGVSE